MGLCFGATQPAYRLIISFLIILILGCLCIFLISPTCSPENGNALSCGLSGNFLDILSSDDAESPPRSDDLEVSEPNPPAPISNTTAYQQFSLSPVPCSPIAPPFILLAIFSRPADFARRVTIRQTYGSLTVGSNVSKSQCSAVASSGPPLRMPLGIRLTFIVGQTEDAVVQKKLVEEAGKFGDVIQSVAFKDDYGQATRKGLATIHWSLLNCPQVPFTAKADDDCYLNLPLLLKALRTHLPTHPSVYGLYWPSGANVIRDPKNKWAVSVADFPDKKFPPYVSGILYTFDQKALQPIAEAAGELKYLWHDDVFLTGMAAEKAGVDHVALSGYDTYGSSWRSPCSKKNMLAIHYVNDEKIWKLWNDTCHVYEFPC